MKDWVQ